MKVTAFKCPTCSSIIFSRTRHDYRWCPCRTIAVDGGLDYARVVYNDTIPESVSLTVIASKEQLYDDWNKRVDKFGIVLPGDNTNSENTV